MFHLKNRMHKVLTGLKKHILIIEKFFSKTYVRLCCLYKRSIFVKLFTHLFMQLDHTRLQITFAT